MSERKSTTRTVVTIIGIFALLFLLFIAVSVYSFFTGMDEGEEYTHSLSGGQKIGLVTIETEIFSSEEVINQINSYLNSSSIAGLLVRVNSPGGAVAPSQEIYEAIKKFRETGRPVVVSMGSVAASGGYYLALGGSTIMANSGTITGSIGVIIQYPQFKELMDKVGIDMTTIKTGDYKDVGSPFRAATLQDKDYLQSVINDTYNQFMEVVAAERKIEFKTVETLAQGKIYTGRQAYFNGLIDTLGTFEDAKKLMGEMTGLGEDPTIVKRKIQRRFFDIWLGEETAEISRTFKSIANPPFIQYRMLP